MTNETFITEWEGPEGYARGPLSLLWSLIESYKVDIFSVSLDRITTDFLEYIKRNPNMDLGEASEFSLMAGNLLYYKSRELLPHSGLSEEDENPNAIPPELVYQLLEYKKFQLASGKFKQLVEDQAKCYIRQGGQDFYVDDESIPIEVNLADLIHSFVNLMSKAEEESEVIHIPLEEITVAEKITHIKDTLNNSEKIFFGDLFSSEKPGRIEIVVCFIAMLELVRQNYIHFLQNVLFGVIEIIKVQKNG